MKGTVLALFCAIALISAELNEKGCPINPYVDILKPHPNCNKYYQCVQGELYERPCASDLLFNEETQECDWAINVNCGNRPIAPEGSGEAGNDSNASGGSSESGDNSNSDGERSNEDSETSESNSSSNESGNDSGSNSGGGNGNPCEAPKICAAEGSDGVLVAHENCNQFYECSGGLPVAFYCPLNLLYNYEKEQCDWPENVNCEGRNQGGNGDNGNSKSVEDSSSEEADKEDGNNDNNNNNGGGNGNPSEAREICAAEGSDGVLVAHENCNQFYKCSEGLPVALDCPLNLLYNYEKEQCDWPENVKCEGRNQGGNGDNGNGKSVEDSSSEEADKEDGNNDNNNNNGGGNGNPSEARDICAAEGSDGVLVAHENCNQFYECSQGSPVAFYCPLNLLYNYEKEQCDWPENVKCEGRNEGGNGDNGNGKSVEDSSSEEADKEDGNNDNNNNNSGGNGNPSEARDICAAEGSDGVLVAHENCNQFYECSQGSPVAFYCPLNLLYNYEKEQCDWPENVKCEGRNEGGNGDNGNGKSVEDSSSEEADKEDGNNDSNNNNGGGNGNPSEAREICAAVGSDGVLIAHENCNQFYKCSEGLPVALDCPLNLLYNYEKEQCDWPENVNCEGRNQGGNGDNGNGKSVEDSSSEEADKEDGNNDNNNNNGGGNGNPSEAREICAAEGSDGVLVAHENCNQFYECSQGSTVAFYCPLNLLYNYEKEQCDWPENVKCEGRNEGGNGDNGNGKSVEDSSSEEADKEDGNNDSNNNNGGGNGNPSEAREICAAEGSDGVLVAHENCNQFYKCSEGSPVALDCPLNLLYNYEKEQCDWPENVKCEGRNQGGNGDNGNGKSVEDSSSEEADKEDGNNDNNNNNGGGNGNPSEARDICAAEGSDGVLVAHENCNQFYECSQGSPVAFYCPLNLLYNYEKEQCDWPENVKCEGRNEGGNGDNGNGKSVEDSSSEEADKEDGNNDSNNNNGGGNGNPSEAREICAAEGSDGVLVAHENCNQFYKCSEGSPVALDCPLNLLYNYEKEQCDWPENVKCEGRNQGGNGDNGNGKSVEDSSSEEADKEGGNNDSNNNNGGGNGNPSEAREICAAEGSDGVLVAHENCNQFYECWEGSPVAFYCPSNLLYNYEKEQCDWPENVNCEGRNQGGNGDNGNGKSVEDSSSEEADKEDGNNDNNNNNGGGNGNPSEAREICAAEGSDGVLVAHENCNQFYECSQGSPVAFYCPLNLLYNYEKEQCDWPENVKCEGRNEGGNGDNGNGKSVEDSSSEEADKEDGNNDSNNNNGGGNGNPSEAREICAAEGSDGVLVAHENCNQFYKCSEGSPVALDCPLNLLYNYEKEQCDWPGNVKCEGRNQGGNGDNGNGKSVEDSSSEEADKEGGNNDSNNNNGGGNGNPSEAREICAAEGSDGVLVAHENCNQFYECWEGSPVAFYCPSNLLYNYEKDQCDWPENVNCEGRNQGGNGDNINGKSVEGISSEEADKEDGNNDNNNNNGGGNGNPSEVREICAAEGSHGALVAHENCNQFYKCSEGLPVAFYCPLNLLYNYEKEQCDWPENVNCEGRNQGGNGDNSNGMSIEDSSSEEADKEDGNNDNNINNGGGNGNPSEAREICAAEGSDGVLVAHENCNQFYKCSEGSPVALDCPLNLLYNYEKEQCDWPENVNCEGRNQGGNGDNSNGMSVEDSSSEEADKEDGNNDNNNNNGGGNGNPSEAREICAAEGSDGVLVAHENCNQFYECSGGLPVAFYCPLNLLYNYEKEQCDWPENVNCEGRNQGGNGENSNGMSIEDSSSEEADKEDGNNDNNINNGGGNGNPSEAREICAAEGSDGVLVAHENCNQFYKCSEGSPVALDCPLNLLYNYQKEQCDWPENVNCEGRNQGGNGDNSNGMSVEDSSSEEADKEDGNNDNNNNNGGGNGNHSEAPKICAGDGSDGVLVAHENCNQFYECSGGLPVAFYCPLNLLYNYEKEQCDWPENVNCEGRNQGGNGDNGNGKSVEDSSSEEADKEDGNNDNNNNNGGGNGNPSEAREICAAEGSDGVLVAHENCNQFYKCSEGSPVALDCPLNLLYNYKKEQCDWPENVNCEGRNQGVEDSNSEYADKEDRNNDNNGNKNNGGGNRNLSETPKICAAEGSDGVLVAHENCNQFYKCSEGSPVALDCPLNLLYNYENEQCDWPENVNCEGRNQGGNGDNGNDKSSEEADKEDGNNDNNGDNNNGGGNGNPSEAPKICAAEGSDGVLVAHENCNQFYKCSEGSPVALDCPLNLLYNYENEQCDWPENVNCEGRNQGGNGDNGNSVEDSSSRIFTSLNKHLRFVRM